MRLNLSNMDVSVTISPKYQFAGLGGRFHVKSTDLGIFGPGSPRVFLSIGMVLLM